MKRLAGIGAVLAAAILLAGCGRVAVPGSAGASGSTEVKTGDPSMTASTSAVGIASGDEQAAPEESEAGSEPVPEPVSQPSEPADTEADCAEIQGWDAAAERADFSHSGAISDVTAAAKDCYDSISIHIEPGETAPGYTVEYVPQVVMDGSSAPVPLTSAAKLQVIVTTPAYHDDGGTITWTLDLAARDNLVDVSGLAAVEQVAFAGSFEGQTTFGIGVAAKLPFTVTADRGDDGSTTLTVSIAHA